MKNNEIEIGDKFQYGFVNLECVESNDCEGCVFGIDDTCYKDKDYVGECESYLRSDNKGVIFKKVE